MSTPDPTLLRTIEVVVVLALSVALLLFSAGEGRRVLRYWAAAGVAFFVREASALRIERNPGGLLTELFPWPFISQFGEHVVLVMLVCGAVELRRPGMVPRRSLVIALLMAAVLALGVVSIPGVATRDALAWRGVIAVTCATAMLVAMVLLRGAPMAGPVLGRRVLAAVLVLLAAERLAAGYHALAQPRGWMTWEVLDAAPLLELVLIVVGLVATVVLLLEREQAETESSRQEALRAERQLQSSETWFRQLIDGGSDIITVLDDDAVIRFESPAVERVLGWRPDENLGQPAIRLVHPEDQARVAATIEQVVQRRTPIASVTYRYRAKDGTYRLLESGGKEIGAEDGKRRFVVNSRDVTEREQLEQRLLHAEKLESVGRLAGGVAHDFNNLLTVIISNTALARVHLPGEFEAMRELDEVAGAAARAARLTSQLLAFSRRQVVALQEVDLNAATTGLLSMLRRLVGERVEFATDLAPGLPPVLADLGQLEQVITNLVVNARDAMPGGGLVRLRTEVMTLEGPRATTGDEVPQGTWVALRVSDTGPGVAPASRGRLFEPFFTTKERGRGTGLGLATCYGIVRRHGGYIWYEDAPDGGASFIICLPPATAGVTHHAAPVLPAADAVRGHETVLLVEDDAKVRSTTERILSEFGYAVVTAEHGEAALSLLATMPLPDVVVTDVVMPRMDGLALMARLRERAPDLPIVLVSGYSDHPEALARAHASHTRYVAKPFTPVELLTAMRALLDVRATAGAS